MEQGELLSAGEPLSAAALARRLRAAAGLPLRPPAPDGRPRGDHDLNPDLYRAEAVPCAAAVLVPLVERGGSPRVLLTRRSARLAHHAGQISFPGGRAEPEDLDAVATALRETREEIGLAPELVQPLGQLDLYVTRTGFAVTPVVGWVEGRFALEELVLDRREVDEAFEVPLDFFLDPANRQRHARRYAGGLRHFYVYPYGDYYIWGATAGMLSNLAEVLAAELPETA